VRLIFYLLEDAGGAGGQVELEPTLVVTYQTLVIDGVVNHLVVVEAVASEVGIVRIENVLVGALLDHETVVGIGVVGAEVEEEQQVAATEGKHLVAVVVPYLYDILFLEALMLLGQFKHCCIEIT